MNFLNDFFSYFYGFAIQVLEDVKNININRHHNNGYRKLIRKPSFWEYFSDIKTPISINVSRSISIICLFIFIHSGSILSATALKSKSNRNMDAPTELTLSDVQTVVKTLLGNDAKTTSSSIDGANKFGTAPVPNAYIGLGNTDLSSTLENINGFLGTYQYGSQAKIDDAEWGTVGRVRFLLSSRGSKTANASGLAADVYNTFICGMEAFATASLESDNAGMIYHDYNIAGGPLELHSTAGWRMSHACAITNESWICNLKSTL